MTDGATGNGTREIAFEAFGARVLLSASPAAELDRVTGLLPPGWFQCDPEGVTHSFALLRDADGGYGVRRDGLNLSDGLPLDLALQVLDSQLRSYVSLNAPDMVFVHAGVVAHRGKAVVIPGLSFSGKTTLVAALVQAGAVYYSDEFAVLDEQGLAYPYAKPLSIRADGHWSQTDHHVSSLGGTAGTEPMPIGLVVATNYRPEAEWVPRRLSRGEGILAMMENTGVAEERPEQTMRVITRAMKSAAVLQSDRGEAEAIAPLLLAELEK